MAPVLKSPPFMEAVCEFRFSPESTWDWTLPGQLYDAIKIDFPERSQVNNITVQLSEEGKASKRVGNSPERVQMKRSDGSAIVQIGPQLLSVNHLKPYPGWDAFKDLIKHIFSRYAGICGNCKVEQVALRYINGLPINEDGDVGALIVIWPALPEPLERPLANFLQRYDLVLEDESTILTHQTGTSIHNSQKMLMIDLAFSSLKLRYTAMASEDALTNWLEKAHATIEEAFIASLNPECYARMKGD